MKWEYPMIVGVGVAAFSLIGVGMHSSTLAHADGEEQTIAAIQHYQRATLNLEQSKQAMFLGLAEKQPRYQLKALIRNWYSAKHDVELAEHELLIALPATETEVR